MKVAIDTRFGLAIGDGFDVDTFDARTGPCPAFADTSCSLLSSRVLNLEDFFDNKK